MIGWCTVETTEHRKARAWYVRYPLDAYALGPLRFNEPVTADVAIAGAAETFGDPPAEIWPDGPCEEVEEYPIKLRILE